MCNIGLYGVRTARAMLLKAVKRWTLYYWNLNALNDISMCMRRNTRHHTHTIIHSVDNISHLSSLYVASCIYKIITSCRTHKYITCTTRLSSTLLIKKTHQMETVNEQNRKYYIVDCRFSMLRFVRAICDAYTFVL